MRWYLRIVMATTIGHESVVEDMMRDRDLVARRVAKEGDNWVGYGQFRETEDDPLSELEQLLYADDDVVEYETRRTPFPGEPVGATPPPPPPPPAARRTCDSETAMLAGMERGCEGYNEAMGCSLEPRHGDGDTRYWLYSAYPGDE